MVDEIHTSQTASERTYNTNNTGKRNDSQRVPPSRNEILRRRRSQLALISLTGTQQMTEDCSPTNLNTGSSNPFSVTKNQPPKTFPTIPALL